MSIACIHVCSAASSFLTFGLRVRVCCVYHSGKLRVHALLWSYDSRGISAAV